MKSDGIIDNLVKTAVLESEIELGLNLEIAGKRSGLGKRGALIARRRVVEPIDEDSRQARWTEEEETFLRENLGKMSLEEIGKSLGRTATAVKLRFTRKGFPAPSKMPDELTNRKVAGILGKCGKSTAELIRRGVLPARELPTGSGRLIRVIKKSILKRWLIDPGNWIYFDVQRMKPGKYRRLVELAQDRWIDKWITTGQAAEMLGACSSNVINTQIRRGKFKSARRWRNWHLLQSEVAAKRSTFIPGKGAPGRERLNWSIESDAFMLLAHGVGHRLTSIAVMMGGDWRENRVEYRLKKLAANNRLGQIMRLRRRELQGLEIVNIRASGVPELFAPWQLHAGRFPAIARAADRFRREKATASDTKRLWQVLRVWALRYGLDDVAKSLRYGHGLNAGIALRNRYEDLLRAGIDPIAGHFDNR